VMGLRQFRPMPPISARFQYPIIYKLYKRNRIIARIHQALRTAR
jgi:hypothetical protein